MGSRRFSWKRIPWLYDQDKWSHSFNIRWGRSWTWLVPAQWVDRNQSVSLAGSKSCTQPWATPQPIATPLEWRIFLCIFFWFAQLRLIVSKQVGLRVFFPTSDLAMLSQSILYYMHYNSFWDCSSDNFHFHRKIYHGKDKKGSRIEQKLSWQFQMKAMNIDSS